VCFYFDIFSEPSHQQAHMAIGRLPQSDLSPTILLQSHAKGIVLWTVCADTAYVTCAFVPFPFLDSVYNSVCLENE
jgi:hypothetical protein